MTPSLPDALALARKLKSEARSGGSSTITWIGGESRVLGCVSARVHSHRKAATDRPEPSPPRLPKHSNTRLKHTPHNQPIYPSHRRTRPVRRGHGDAAGRAVSLPAALPDAGAHAGASPPKRFILSNTPIHTASTSISCIITQDVQGDAFFPSGWPAHFPRLLWSCPSRRHPCTYEIYARVLFGRGSSSSNH